MANKQFNQDNRMVHIKNIAVILLLLAVSIFTCNKAKAQSDSLYLNGLFQADTFYVIEVPCIVGRVKEKSYSFEEFFSDTRSYYTTVDSYRMDYPLGRVFVLETEILYGKITVDGLFTNSGIRIPRETVFFIQER